MLEQLISLLAPHQCVHCGREGTLLCQWCTHDAIPPIPERCYHCKKLSAQSRVCATCRKKSGLDHVWATTPYAGDTKALIHAVKFARGRMGAATIARLMNEYVPALPPEKTVVTYIPTATSRVRLRGYDQSQLIAREFARLRGMKLVCLLERHGQARQVGATKRQRLAQAAASYRTKRSLRVSEETVVIVDDILTTGATLEAAAKLLKQSGVQHINAAVFAQKQ